MSISNLDSPNYSAYILREPDHNSGEVSQLVNEAAIVTEQSVPKGERGGEEAGGREAAD